MSSSWRTMVNLHHSEREGMVHEAELSSTAGWHRLQTVTDKNIAGAIVDFILAKLG